MLYLKPEGGALKSGLNITVKKWWFTLIWVSVDLSSLFAKSYYFRFRLLPGYPRFFFSSNTFLALDGYLWDRNLVLVTREVFDDYVLPRIEKDNAIKS